jgi:MFS family permease
VGLPRSLGPRYTRVWIANGVSGLGDGITAAAGPLLMTTVTADPRLISAAVAAQQLPALLLSLPMGALVDRFDKRRVAIGADLLRTLTSGILAMLVATGHVTVPAIYTLLFFEGIGAIADRTSGAALVPGLIAPEDIPAANNRQFATSSLTVFLVGPPIGAALFLADRWVPFTVDAVSFFGSMLLLVVQSEGEHHGVGHHDRR